MSRLSSSVRPLLAILIICFGIGTASGQPGEFQTVNNTELLSPDNAALPGMTLAEINEEILLRTADLERYQSRLDTLTQQNEGVRQQLEERSRVLQGSESAMRARVITLCRLNRGGFVHLLQGSQSWSDFIRRAQLARTVIESDVDMLRDHQRHVEELERERATLSESMAAQQQLQERIVQYRQELEGEAERRRLSQRRIRRRPHRSVPRDEFGDDGWEGGLPMNF